MNHQWNQFILIFSYIIGILICLTFNYILHLLTSESVVHCNHGGDVNTAPTTENLDINGDLENQIGHDYHHHNEDTLFNDGYNGLERTITGETNNNNVTETTPLINNNKTKTKTRTKTKTKITKKRKSIIELILKHDDIEDGLGGECKGYSSAELCTFHNNNNHHHHLHHLILNKLNIMNVIVILVMNVVIMIPKSMRKRKMKRVMIIIVIIQFIKFNNYIIVKFQLYLKN